MTLNANEMLAISEGGGYYFKLSLAGKYSRDVFEFGADAQGSTLLKLGVRSKASFDVAFHAVSAMARLPAGVLPHDAGGAHADFIAVHPP